jgi:dienelactone hydrolase
VRRGVVAIAAGLLVVSGCTGPATSDVRILVAAPDALFDAALGVTVTGAPAGRRITIAASATDAAGHVWRSSAAFTADSSGRIDPARTAPVIGDYTGVHDTGLLWSMTAPGVLSYIAPAMIVHLAASLDGRTVATASLTREWVAASVAERVTTVPQEGFDGTLYSPRDTATRRPAVLAFGGSEGGADTGILVARALASKGYPALGIGYFGAPGLPGTLGDIPLEYFVTALRWLARQPGVDPHHIDVYGVSRGSEAALLLGADFPGLVYGVIAGSPSSVVNVGYPDEARPAWTLQGHPIPHVRAGEFGDPQPAGDPAAVIGVERISGPVFLICGLDDALWPSCPYTKAVAGRLGRRSYTELQEPEAGHYVGVPVPGWIETPDARHGGTQEADARGRLDAWPKLLSYLAAQATPRRP